MERIKSEQDPEKKMITSRSSSSPNVKNIINRGKQQAAPIARDITSAGKQQVTDGIQISERDEIKSRETNIINRGKQEVAPIARYITSRGKQQVTDGIQISERDEIKSRETNQQNRVKLGVSDERQEENEEITTEEGVLKNMGKSLMVPLPLAKRGMEGVEGGVSEEKQENMQILGLAQEFKEKNEQKTIEEGVSKNMDKSKFIEVGVSEKERKIIQDSIRSVANDEWVSSNFVSVKCEPVIEILGVTLRKKNASSSHMYSNNNSLKVYGEIYVQDSEDDGSGPIYIYQRCLEDGGSEISDGTLSLTWPDEGISAMAKPQISLNIRDRNTDEGILVESASLVDKTSAITHHNVEICQATTVPGTDWSADVNYLELRFGVFAYVVVQLEEKKNLSKEGKEEQFIKVYGSISAEYKLSFSDREVESITLFEITEDSDAFECMTLGSSITMSRPVLACPAYSSLMINVKLKDYITKDVILEGSANFQASNADEYIVFHGLNSLDARVICSWEESRMLRELHASKTTVPLWINTCLTPTPSEIPARNLVEVFSLFICRQSNKQLNLSGMVSFSNCDGYHILFRRDKNNPFILPSGCNLLPMEGPSYPLVPQEHFFVSVELEDSDNGVSIKGFVHSDPRLDQQRKPWYDRLLSCVIKGANDCGFAVVHYTVFASALMASLKVHLSIEGEVPPRTIIHGSLIADYCGYGCKTHYERFFHRIVLFERHEEYPLVISPKKSPLLKKKGKYDLFKIKNEFDLELLRYALAVPYDSALQIKVDLTCISSSGIHIPMNQLLEIKPGEKKAAKSQGEIKISLDVKWGTYMRDIF